MNIIKILSEATLVVQLVILLLLFFSIFSWAIIIFKRRTLRVAASQSQRFLTAFRRSKNMSDVSEAARRYKSSPLATLFQAGFKELSYQNKANGPNGGAKQERLESLSRALQKASNGEVTRLEKLMFFLATTGTVSPFIGLFGTVWGIMNSFLAIEVQRSASLITVAPGIAEALIATAIGLFAAIPAVIAYNYFLGRIKDVVSEMEDFTLEFLTIAERMYGA